MLPKLTSYILVFTLTWSTSVLPAAGSPSAVSSGPEPAEPLATSQFPELVAEFRSHIDRSQFDLEALLDELDFEASKIIEFVRSEIAFEQYPGLLRGARGTLTSRAGNTLDQAVLLATLLKDAAYEARILRGRLSEDQARELLGQMRPARAYPPAADFEAMNRALWGDQEPPRLEGKRLEGDGWEPPHDEAIERAVRSLGSALEKQGIDLGDPEAGRQLLEEARDYFWVQARTDAAEWVAVHPALADQQQLGEIGASEIFADRIPSKLQHRIRFQAFIEQKVGDQLKVHPTMDAWERPVANMLGRSFVFLNVPWGLDEESLEARWPWEDSLDEAELFLPVFADGIPPGAKAFDRDGVPFAVDLLAAGGLGATALVREVAGKFERAAGELSGTGSERTDSPPENLMALTAQWVEYTLIAPGGEETTHRRMILDRLGPAARKRDELGKLSPPREYRRLLTRHTFSLTTGRTPPGFLIDEVLAEFGRLTASFEAGLTSDSARDRHPALALPEPFLFAMFERMEMGREGLLYRSGPTLFTRQEGLEPAGDRLRFFGDIVRSQWRAFRWEGDSGPLASPALVMRQGVWETATEDYLATLAHARGAAFNSPSAMELGDPVVVSAGTLAREPVAGLGANAETLLREDLEAGWVAVLNGAEELQQLNREVVWWRVEPGSGETLGIGMDGRGPITIEWSMKHTLWAVVLGFSLACYGTACDDYYKCIDAPDPRCCISRFVADRRAELVKSFPGTLLVKFHNAAAAFVGRKPYDPSCLFETSPPLPPPTRQ